MTVPMAKVPLADAATAIPKMEAAGIVDKHAKISRMDGFHLVPLMHGCESKAADMGFEITQGTGRSQARIPPITRILEDLVALPKEVLNDLPNKWEYVGKIVIIKLCQSAEPYKKEIGLAYATELGAETVCVDRNGVSGEYREPNMETIYGTVTVSTRLENGIMYRFDVTKVMFASGNTEERERMEHLDCSGETVIDMFAGIGYFTLPIAKFARPAKIIACEKNPASFAFLKQNIELNGVSDIVNPVLGDNRDLPGNHIADRILMGYVQRTSEFIPKALALIKKRGILHYHDTFYIHEGEARLREIFDRACGPDGYEVLGFREVKSYAPAVSHYVADIRIL
jgi:tRNA wybutosine-synthesizing protein 2